MKEHPFIKYKPKQFSSEETMRQLRGFSPVVNIVNMTLKTPVKYYNSGKNRNSGCSHNSQWIECSYPDRNDKAASFQWGRWIWLKEFHNSL